MKKDIKPTDEFTELMHSEMSVSPEVEIKHIVQTAMSTIDQGIMTLAEAMDVYGITLEDIDKHTS